MQRRSFLLGLMSVPLLGAAAASDPFAAIESSCGGRLGVAAIDTATGTRLLHRANERFALASTFKLPTVMMILAQADAGRVDLNAPLHFAKSDLEPPYSDISQEYPDGGTLSVRELCRLSISESDNTAQDLLLARFGGPPAVTAYVRTLGLTAIRIDRRERDLPRYAAASEPRDTGTPLAMATLASLLVTGSPLSPASTSTLLAWMFADGTNARRFRAGLPKGWRAADKTGSYMNAWNDVGLLFPPRGKPIALACYLMDAKTDDGANAAVAATARAAIAAMGG